MAELFDVSLKPIASRNLWIRQTSDGFGLSDVHRGIVADIVEGVRSLKGDKAAETIARDGLEELHKVIDSVDVGPLRDFVLERKRRELLHTAVSIGRNVLRWTDDFYVDDYLILRINFPYEVARNAAPSAENPGVGRVSPAVREIAKARRVIDPVYDPKGYHKGHPPAAWAHGPHLDTWGGHSTDGLNIWWAMCEVPAEASMVLYPELIGKELPPEQKTLYLKPGYRLPKPTYLPLAAGEMLVFDPEILHGTHLNVTMHTRVAVSLRLNARKPSFDPGCFYAREFWHRANAIEAGRYDEVLHLKREDNLSAPRHAAQIDWPQRLKKIHVRDMREGTAVDVGPSSLVADGERVVVQLPDRRVLLHRIDGVVRAVDAACPHYGVDLADGGCDREKLYCPACGIGFDIVTGKSGAPSLSLTGYGVREEGNRIVLDVFADLGAQSESHL